MKSWGPVCLVALVLVYGFALAAGLRGIDFGWHWDEDRLLEAAGQSFTSATLLPNRYNYPSVSYALTLSGALPEAAAALGRARRVLATGADKEQKKERLSRLAADFAAIVDRPLFRLRVRTVFLVVSLLSVLWVYLASLAWRRDPREALLAAALVATSWEVGYHARWMAPDTVLMQFAALALTPLFLARRPGARAWRWLAVAAVAAGLAMGSKYQGVVLLAPVLAVAFERARAEGRGAAAALAARLLPLALLSGAVFLATSPGIVLQPIRCAYDLLFEMRHYHTGHGSETVAPGAEHAARILEYLSLVAFSRYWPLALLVFGAAVAGAVDVLRRDRGAAVVLLFAPALALLSMLSLRVMIVRNLLFLLPVLAILAARGVRALSDALPGRIAPAVPWIAAAALVSANAAWLWSAADSIAGRAAIDTRADIGRYLAAHPRERFGFSCGAYDSLSAADRARPNVSADSANATRFLILTSDVRTPYGDRYGVYDVVSGPFEVNYDWYPDWRGDPRVVAVSARDATRLRWRSAPTGH